MEKFTDQENPLVDVIPFVSGFLYHDVTIPCKPTSKSVQVDLLQNGVKVSGCFFLILWSFIHSLNISNVTWKRQLNKQLWHKLDVLNMIFFEHIDIIGWFENLLKKSN